MLTGAGRASGLDFFACSTGSRLYQNRLSRALGFRMTPQAWSLEAWHPFALAPNKGRFFRLFRYCQNCIRVGFHSEFHQLPWITSCPWHQEPLQVDCPSCGRSTFGNTTLCKALLTCECGFDLFDPDISIRQRAAPGGAIRTMDAYLAWCERERKMNTIVCSSRTGDAYKRLYEVVVVPKDVIGLAERSRPPALGTSLKPQFDTDSSRLWLATGISGAQRSGNLPCFVVRAMVEPFYGIATSLMRHGCRAEFDSQVLGIQAGHPDALDFRRLNDQVIPATCLTLVMDLLRAVRAAAGLDVSFREADPFSGLSIAWLRVLVDSQVSVLAAGYVAGLAQAAGLPDSGTNQFLKSRTGDQIALITTGARPRIRLCL